MDYPGASPEIVESEVTKKIEEAVNTMAGINSLSSRSYEGTLGRHRRVQPRRRRPQGGRRRAREGRADPPAAARRGQGAAHLALRPRQRSRSSTWRVLRHRRQARAPQELTTWATQVLQKRLENVRGVGSVSAGGRRAAPDQPLPEARRRWKRWASASTRWWPRVRSENQELPVGAIRSLRAGARGADQRAAEAPRRLPRHRRRAQGRQRRSGCGRWPTWSTARRRSRAWRSTTASARCCCRCRRARAKTPSPWSTA